MAGVAANVGEGPAQRPQAVVGSVASPVHQVLPSLLPDCQIKTAKGHLSEKQSPF